MPDAAGEGSTITSGCGAGGGNNGGGIGGGIRPGSGRLEAPIGDGSGGGGPSKCGGSNDGVAPLGGEASPHDVTSTTGAGPVRLGGCEVASGKPDGLWGLSGSASRPEVESLEEPALADSEVDAQLVSEPTGPRCLAASGSLAMLGRVCELSALRALLRFTGGSEAPRSTKSSRKVPC